MDKKPIQVGSDPICPRCGGIDFLSSEVRRDPVTFEVIHHLLCVKRECQEVVGVMSRVSLSEVAL